MKRINEAESRMLSAGGAKIMLGKDAKEAAGMPDGYLVYAYCPNDGKSLYGRSFVNLVVFLAGHSRCVLR